MINFPHQLLLADIIPPGYAINNGLVFVAGDLLINFIINALFLSIAYIILRRAFLLKSFKFIKYVVLATIGGFLIDLIFVAGNYSGSFFSRPGGAANPLINEQQLVIRWASIIITSLGLIIYNYYLSRKFFGLTKKQALFVGLAIGVLTNPIFSEFVPNYLVMFYKQSQYQNFYR